MYRASPVNGADGSAPEDRILRTLAKHGIRSCKSEVGGEPAELDGIVEIWGTGKPLREFLWSLDMAEGCVFLMERDERG
ncbi:NAD-dependent epimerase/dehydratase family protein [Desulfoglaeba alkanexedens ALDC]|uniref:NAD-dependent epimerase/dehydratase family protein n=1 Tax=Desulfoglaeba alkanexedens ALDC TaxID=980445 RepID=A0A4P8KZH2_9BACT|nr:NAD-dependent epimerase/dehydratase family protein [Desulfoglaeba alkanexedens ALDC]